MISDKVWLNAMLSTILSHSIVSVSAFGSTKACNWFGLNPVPSTASSLLTLKISSANIQEIDCSKCDYINPLYQTHFSGAFLPELSRPKSVPNDAPPPSTVVCVPGFLTPQECSALIQMGETLAAEEGNECEEYLNARVNGEVKTKGSSDEALNLISALDDQSSISLIDSSNKGGFRVRASEEFINNLLCERVLKLMGLEERIEGFLFKESPVLRPTPRRICIRDQTIVRYEVGDGVPPHVDGKDATLLIYLNTVDKGAGGRTVFPEDGLAVEAVQGTALLYRSKHELLHFSEPIKKDGSVKFILQLLIDYRHDYKKGDTVVDFTTGSSYIY